MLLAVSYRPSLGMFSQNASCWRQSRYTDLQLRKKDFHSYLFGKYLRFLLKQNKEETMKKSNARDQQKRTWRSGILWCYLARFSSSVSDKCWIASNWCLVDCLPLQVILNCCEGRTPKETIENLLHRMTEEKTLTAEGLVKLLQAVKATFPNLGLLLEKLQKSATFPSATGIS